MHGPLLAFTALACALASPAASQTIEVGGFDASRGRSLATTGSLGYDTLRAALTSPAFQATAGCAVALAPETPVASAAYLLDKSVFFVGDGSGFLAASEAADIAAWHASGGTLVLIGESGGLSDMAASVLLAIGATASYSTAGCAGSAAGGVVTGADNPVTNGPFGDVRGATYGVSLAAGIAPGSATPLVTCLDGTLVFAAHPPGTVGGPASGGVYLAGDPCWLDVFTSPAGGLFNPNNLTVALNTFAAACPSGSEITVVCDPANDHSGGSYVTLAGSTLGFPPGSFFSGLKLDARDGPAGEFGYFLVSAGANANLTVGNGVLCLDAPLGRYAPPAGTQWNSAGQFDAAGTYRSSVQSQIGWDVPFPLPTPPGGLLLAGSTWSFQMWYRDGQRSNLSNAIQVQF